MDHPAIKRIFKRATQKGHFELHSLKHSDAYVEKADICQDPLIFDSLCGEIALEVYSQSIDVDVVVGPAPIGAIIAYQVAFHLQELYRQIDKLRRVRFIFTEKIKEKNKKDQHIFRRSFCKNLTDKKILVVDDILTEGMTITELLKALAQKNGTQIAGIAVFCNRGGLTSKDFNGFPLICLSRLKLKAWTKETCPLCQRGILIEPKY